MAQGRALAGIQNLELGDGVSLDGQKGEIVRVDIETTPQERLFHSMLESARLKVRRTPDNPECDAYFHRALTVSVDWKQALEVATAASQGPLGQTGQVAGDAFSMATDRCLTAQDCLSVAQTAAMADDKFFRWQVRAALRKGLRLAQTAADAQLIVQAAQANQFPLLAAKAEKLANPPR